MAKCKHYSAVEVTRRGNRSAFVAADLIHHKQCLDCGAWLSLGPANDEPPEVQIEIRAAEIAASDRPIGECDWLEWAGWVTERTEDSLTTWRGLAGYLARAIVHHDDGGG